VVTESGILHQMRKAAPEKTFIPAPPEANCACNECPFMKRNTLEKLYRALRDLQPRIELPEDVRLAALRPIQRMLARDSERRLTPRVATIAHNRRTSVDSPRFAVCRETDWN
jgi:quinolinate synthase